MERVNMVTLYWCEYPIKNVVIRLHWRAKAFFHEQPRGLRCLWDMTIRPVRFRPFDNIFKGGPND